MAFPRLSSMVLRNLIARRHQGLRRGREEGEFILGAFRFSGYGAAPVTFHSSSFFGASGAEYYVSSRKLHDFTVTKRAELKKQGSYWNPSSFVSTRSASTVSGKTQGTDVELETANAAVSGIEKKEAETAISKHDMEKWKGKGLANSSYWGIYPAHFSRQDGSPSP